MKTILERRQFPCVILYVKERKALSLSLSFSKVNKDTHLHPLGGTGKGDGGKWNGESQRAEHTQSYGWTEILSSQNQAEAGTYANTIQIFIQIYNTDSISLCLCVFTSLIETHMHRPPV